MSEFWMAKSGKKHGKIGFGRVFSAVLGKIPFFRPKREPCWQVGSLQCQVAFFLLLYKKQ